MVIGETLWLNRNCSAGLWFERGKVPDTPDRKAFATANKPFASRLGQRSRIVNKDGAIMR